MSADKHPVVVTASQQLIREQLDRMLVSPIFLRADRISKLLRHVVEKTLAGQESDLTEKKIAEELYGIDDYLPEVHTTVRDAARRLRIALREYVSEPINARVVISLPRGSYVPRIEVDVSATEGQKQPRVRLLRSVGTMISINQAKVMLAEQDFFCADWNENGKGIEHRYNAQVREQCLVVVDEATQLMWEKGVERFRENGLMSAEEVQNRPEQRMSEVNRDRFAGFTDWRLPTVEEAMSLMMTKQQAAENMGALRLYLHPVFERVGTHCIWTSDWWEYRIDSGHPVDPYDCPWVVDFRKGECRLERRGSEADIKAVRSMSSHLS
jgi:hypothetical protein